MDPLTLECLVHDLNNVFQTLGDAGELLAADPKWAHLAGAIVRGVAQGREILASLAEEQPPSAVKLETVVSGAIQFCSDCLSGVADRGRIQFIAAIEPSLQIWAAEAAIERAIVNLLLNAVQAMPMGGEVDIRAQLAGDRVNLSIGDRGPGIPPEILSEIFKPHFTTRTAHFGLGLHIVGTIVRQNNGTVAAANRSDGPGAVFTVSLPAAGQVQRLSAGS